MLLDLLSLNKADKASLYSFNVLNEKLTKSITGFDVVLRGRRMKIVKLLQQNLDCCNIAAA